MAITIGSNNISKIYVGSSEVSKIYLGSTEVYSAGSPSPMPSKGDIIQMDLDGTSRDYRVLAINGNIAKVMGLFDYSANIGVGYGPTNVYETSYILSQLENDFYGNLPSAIKAAIPSKTFYQKSYYTNTNGDPDYTGKHSNGTTYYISVASNQFGNQITSHVNLLQIQDILDYLEVTSDMTASNTTLTRDNVYDMCWGSLTRTKSLMLMDAYANQDEMMLVVYNNGRIYEDGIPTRGTDYRARMVFEIDLTNISWTI